MEAAQRYLEAKERYPVGSEPPAGRLKKLERLFLAYTQVSDAGCATLASALYSGALPALEALWLKGSRASAAWKNEISVALGESRAA